MALPHKRPPPSLPFPHTLTLMPLCAHPTQVAYTASDPSPTAPLGALVRLEGWMLLRTSTRVLLVAVQDPEHLDALVKLPV